MKTFLWASILLTLCCGITKGYSQMPQVFPIPSYNVEVHSEAVFEEDHSQSDDFTDAKRSVNIRVNSASGSYNCQAVVWVYSLDLLTVLGPFYCSCDQTLVVPIDDREWGVFVQSDDEILVSVWITEEESFGLMDDHSFSRPDDSMFKPDAGVANDDALDNRVIPGDLIQLF